jgi:hypothetical protein
MSVVEGFAVCGRVSGVEGVRAFTISGDHAAERKTLTVLHSACAPGTSWCARADEIFGVDGLLSSR